MANSIEMLGRAAPPNGKRFERDKDKRDPASRIPGMPPNYGREMLPHVLTFQGIISSVSRVYRPSDEALRDSWDNARFMRNDVTVMECVEQRQRSCALLDWHIEPDDQKNPEQLAIADELKLMLENIPRFMQYRENLLHATWYGKYGISHQWRVKILRGKRYRTLARWRSVHGDKIVFRYDDRMHEYDPDGIGIRVGSGLLANDETRNSLPPAILDRIEPTDWGLAYFMLPWERPLLAIHKHYIEDGEYEDPYNAGRIHGVGVRSRIYWTWYQKQETLAALMQFIERSASGVEIWYYPFGNAEAEEATRKAAEERIGENRNIVMVPRPMGDEGIAYDVQRIEPGMGGADAMQRIVGEYFGHQIKRFILGQTLTSEAQATGLGSSLADVHLDTYMQIVRYDARLLEESITTQLLQPHLDMNFPRWRDVPFRFRINTEESDVERKLAAWKDAYEMGMEIPAADLGNMLGIREPDQDEKVLSLQSQQEEQAKLQQEGQQQQMEMQQQGQQQQMQMQQDAQAEQAGAKLSEEDSQALESLAEPNEMQKELAQNLAQAGAQTAGEGVPAPSQDSERKKLAEYARDQDLRVLLVGADLWTPA